ncbi:MAG: hypothetical protein RIR49_2140 [Actinomycetota bacterium]
MHPPDGTRILPLVFAATLTGIMGNSLVSPLIPDMLDTFGRSDASAGPLVAAASLPGIVLAPLIGIAADRWGRRPILTLCLGIFGLAGVFTAIAPTFELLLVTRLLMGMGSAGLVNLGVVLIGDHFDGEERTLWIGRNAAVLTVGVAIIPLLSGIAAEWVGWRATTVAYTLGFAGALYAWLFLRGEARRDAQTVRGQLVGIGIALRNPVIVTTLAAGTLTFAVIFGVFLTALPTHLENRFGLSSGWRGVIIGAPAITAALVGFNLGRIRQRIPIRIALSVSAATWVIGMALIGSAGALALVIIGSLSYGIGEGALIPNLQEVAVSAAPPEHRGAVVATWVGFARLGQTSGPLLAGVLLSAQGAPAVFWAGAIASAAAMVAFVLGPIGRTDRPPAAPGP